MTPEVQAVGVREAGAGGDLAGAVPGSPVDTAAHRAVAGEAELTAGPPSGPLEDHAADAVREGAVTDAVEDHLGHRPHALAALAAGLVVGGLGQAFQIARGVQGAAEAERLGRQRAGQADPAQAASARGAAQLFEAGGEQLRLTVALG